MAKNQDLTLNFSKLNGVCGQLKCCLQYEDEVYKEKRSRLPKEGDIISTHTGEIGRVDRLHLLSEQFVMMTNRGVRKRYVVDLYKETLNKEEANFPKEFESVSDETFKVIGLDQAEAEKVKTFEAEVKSYKDQSKSFADSIFENLFGEKSLGYDLPDLAEPESSTKKRIITPDEEEEINYTPSAEDVLEDDEDDVNYNDDKIVTRAPRDEGDRGSRPSGQRQDNRGPRPDNRGPRQDNRGPRPDNRGPRQDNRGPRPEGQGGQRPQGQNQNRDQQNRGPRPQGQGGGNSNQNRNQQNRGPRPPR
jgi:hypothetical protein